MGMTQQMMKKGPSATMVLISAGNKKKTEHK
jgi:hypothetical protein